MLIQWKKSFKMKSNIILNVIDNNMDQCWGSIEVLDKKIIDIGIDTKYETSNKTINTTTEYFLSNGASDVLTLDIISNNDISKFINEYNPDIIKCDINGLEIYLLNINDSIFSRVEQYSIKTHSHEIYRLAENKLIRCGYDIYKRINLTYSPQHSSWHENGNYKIIHAKKKHIPIRTMPPVPDRSDLANIAEKLFKKTNNAIEVGVYAGDFSKHNLKYWSGNYYMCDAWGYRPEDAMRGYWDKNHHSNDEFNIIKQQAINNTSFAGDRVKLIQSLSVDAAKTFDDNFFDWIYLDAMHDYVNIIQDLEAWWPKLRVGGLFSGDDYGLHQSCIYDISNMTPQRWANRYGNTAIDWGWGTLNAVCEFANKYNVVASATWLNDTQQPSWYLIK